ncbi:DNA polymerase III subunit delta [Candidatus Bipolaricaulota bacterium]|nr:DNA polymerase III subunit delta [Candidatus Bipolaricaulota bacterium]
MSNIVLYHGEPYQREKAVDKTIKKWREELSNPELYRFEGSQLEPEKLEQLLSGSSLFSKTKIIHVSQAEELTGEEAFPEIIESHSFETEALLFESDSLKKSTALYKAIANKGETKKFSEPTGRNFPKYVSKIMADHDVQLTSDAKRWIIQIMEQDLLRVEREAEKLSLYREEGEVTLEEVKKVVWTKGKDKMFDFFDALFTRERESREAIKLLEDMLDEDVDASKIFFMLAKEVRRLIKIGSLADEGCSNKEISDKTGIYNWLVKKKRGQLNNFEMTELEDLLHQLHRQDLRFKQGKTDLEDALFRIVYQTYPAKK